MAQKRCLKLFIILQRRFPSPHKLLYELRRPFLHHNLLILLNHHRIIPLIKPTIHEIPDSLLPGNCVFQIESVVACG